MSTVTDQPPATGLDMGGGLVLPISTLCATTSVLGMTGSGKSHTAAVLVEEAVRAGCDVCVLDPMGSWHGLREGVDGSPGLGFTVVGPAAYADISLEGVDGSEAAGLLERQRWVVADVSELVGAAFQRYAADLLDALFRRPSRRPTLVVLEEADEFAPQNPAAGTGRELVEVCARVVRRGRARGLGVVLISQRSAAVAKDLLSQSKVLLVGRTVSPHDRKAIADWVIVHDRDTSRHRQIEALSTLSDGEFLAWEPERNRLTRAHIRPRRTADRASTPVFALSPTPSAKALTTHNLATRSVPVESGPAPAALPGEHSEALTDQVARLVGVVGVLERKIEALLLAYDAGGRHAAPDPLTRGVDGDGDPMVEVIAEAIRSRGNVVPIGQLAAVVGCLRGDARFLSAIAELVRSGRVRLDGEHVSPTPNPRPVALRDSIHSPSGQASGIGRPGWRV